MPGGHRPGGLQEPPGSFLRRYSSVQEPVCGTDHTSAKESSPDRTDASLLFIRSAGIKMGGGRNMPGKNKKIVLSSAHSFFNAFYQTSEQPGAGGLINRNLPHITVIHDRLLAFCSTLPYIPVNLRYPDDHSRADTR